MEEVTIKYRGRDARCQFTYEAFEPMTRDCAGGAETIDLEAVFVCGVDIYDLLHPDYLGEIETMILALPDESAIDRDETTGTLFDIFTGLGG